MVKLTTRLAIERLIEDKKVLSVRDVATELKLHEDTVRATFRELEKDNVITLQEVRGFVAIHKSIIFTEYDKRSL